METITNFVNWINGIVWGPLMLVLILGTGFVLQVALKLLPIRKIGFGFSLLWKGRTPPKGGEGDISPFNALMTSLSATIGTGNIAGVATAIFLGGPGALFWMWMTALVGMATKYAEAVCAVKYREVDEKGDHIGGPTGEYADRLFGPHALRQVVSDGLGPSGQVAVANRFVRIDDRDLVAVYLRLATEQCEDVLIGQPVNSVLHDRHVCGSPCPQSRTAKSVAGSQ